LNNRYSIKMIKRSTHILQRQTPTNYPVAFSWVQHSSASLSKPLWIYSYSYDHSWVNLPENMIASFEFANNSQIELSNRRLYVRVHQKQTQWRIKDVKKLSLAHKKLILPIITGGITFPFAVLAIHAHVINYWLGIVFGLIGLLLIYYGFLGNYQLTIHTATHLFHLFTGEDKMQVAIAVKKINKWIDYFKRNSQRESSQKTFQKFETFGKLKKNKTN